MYLVTIAELLEATYEVNKCRLSLYLCSESTFNQFIALKHFSTIGGSRTLYPTDVYVDVSTRTYYRLPINYKVNCFHKIGYLKISFSARI